MSTTDDARAFAAKIAEIARQQEEDCLTSEQVMADLAADTLETLLQISNELKGLNGRLLLLAAFIMKHEFGGQYGADLADKLLMFAHLPKLLSDDEIAETVRDVAQILPVRGIDYGAK